MSKKTKAILYICILSLLFLCLILLNLANYFNKSNMTYEDKSRTINKIQISYPYFNDNKDIYIDEFLSVIDDENVTNIRYIVNYLGEYVNILFKLYQNNIIIDYYSIIFNHNDESVEIGELITNQEIFRQKMLLSIINNNIKISNEELNMATKSYLFKDYAIEIYLTNYNNKKNISLISLNYHEIKDYLNFPFKLSKNYDFLTDEIPKKATTTTTVPVVPPAPPANKKLVAFTFDDGPSDYTLELLDILDEFNAKATFFMVGYQIKLRNSVVLETKLRGHEVGNHTVDHSRLTKFNEELITNKIGSNNELYYNITGSHMMLLRPPYGALNDVVKQVCNLPIIMWSVDSRDWENRNTEKIVEVVLSNIKAGDIVLFHDLYPTTIDAIKVLLPILYDDDYLIVSISDLFSMNGIALENGKIYTKASI